MGIIVKLLRPIGRPIRTILRKFGFDVVRLPMGGSQGIRMRWIERLHVDLIVDVGANKGQFVGWMRDRGYKGPIVSFEPQKEAFQACYDRWCSDPNWRGVQTALGEVASVVDLHVAGNSYSSSLRPMLESHVQALPESAIVSTESVTVRRLDAALPDDLASSRRLFLKIDTQGYEDTVLSGAAGLLERVALIELELSLVPLYDGQALLPEMMDKVAALGFVPVALEPGFVSTVDERLLQVDVVFVRAELLGRV